MLKPTTQDLREALLNELDTRPKYGGDPTAQSVLYAAARRLGIAEGSSNPDIERALLAEWSELFRTGLLAWGRNFQSDIPQSFHRTERGLQAHANLTRDPSNPAGYLRHLRSVATVSPIAQSYISEALDCYVAGLNKASAVMAGGAVERMILDLRDAVAQKLAELGRDVPKGMRDWKVKTVSDALYQFFSDHKKSVPQPLGEDFEANWSSFMQQVRAARNEAGHPNNIDPITYDRAHASLLLLPELAKVADKLNVWVTDQKDLT